MLAHGHGVPVFDNVEGALREPDTALRLFGKPRVEGHRRVGVTLARGSDIDDARARARDAAAAITIRLERMSAMNASEGYAVYFFPQALEALGDAIKPYLREGPGGEHVLCHEIDTGGRADRNDDRSAVQRRAHDRAGTDGPAVDGEDGRLRAQRSRLRFLAARCACVDGLAAAGVRESARADSADASGAAIG